VLLALQEPTRRLRDLLLRLHGFHGLHGLRRLRHGLLRLDGLLRLSMVFFGSCQRIWSVASTQQILLPSFLLPPSYIIEIDVYYLVF
jgi:hypothetical protein